MIQENDLIQFCGRCKMAYSALEGNLKCRKYDCVVKNLDTCKKVKKRLAKNQ